MSKIMQFFQEMHRYARGGDPVPEALDSIGEFLSDREELSSEDWVSAAIRSVNVSREVAAFAYDFFMSFHIPVGKMRLGDRLMDDLKLNEALQDDWDEDLVDEFKKRFEKNLAFTRWPQIDTIADLLTFLQGTITGPSPLRPG